MQEPTVRLSPEILPASGDNHEQERRSVQEPASVLPDHLIGLSDKNWALWRTVGLRGSGFPINQVQALTMPDCAKAADRLLKCEREMERARAEALTALSTRIAQSAPTGELYRQLVKTRRAIRDSTPPWLAKTCQVQSQEIETFHRAYQALLEMEQAFRQTFSEASLQTSQRLRQTARQERFREAVVWQNRHAFHTSVALLGSLPNQTGSRQRQQEILVANYLQRYCTKNDSIGFFGPIGWATLTENSEALISQPGEEFLASREAFLEFWGIEALAETFTADPALRPWLAPRLMPHLYVQGRTLVVPFARLVPLTGQQATVLKACNGSQLACDIAHALVFQHPQLFVNEAEVYKLLEQLQRQNRILWRLAIPPEGAHPERDLRRLLARIGDEKIRQEKLAALTRLEQARAAIQAAAGDAAVLDQALGQLEATFHELTGNDPTRNAGQPYGSRTLVYEDCRRDIEVTLGQDFLRTLDAPLLLMLQSARWLTYEMGNWYEAAFAQAYQDIAQQSNTDCIDFSRFWLWMLNQLFDDSEHVIDQLREDFQQRWEAVLGKIPEDVQHVAYTSAELRPRVQEMFFAPRPGWNGGRYHSPDVLISAASPEAIRRGDYQIILGELHVAMNTLQLSLFLSQHPEHERLIQNAAEDLPEARLLPVLSKHAPPSSGRMRPYLINPKDARLIYTADTGIPDHPHIFSTGELVIEQVEGKLMVCLRDHTWQCNLVEAFGELLELQVYHCFKMFPVRRHTPRITLDEKVVIAREAWEFPGGELAVAYEKDAARQFVEIRRWAQEHHLPQRMFVRVSHQQKPCFLDLDSLVSVANFAKLVRKSQEKEGPEAFVTLSEMLPGTDQLWLTDKDTQHYTSELRVVALDLVKAFSEV